MGSFLNEVNAPKAEPWDVKRYLKQATALSSPFRIEPLSKHIDEHKTKIKPFESPGEAFSILGVNNKTGLFDAMVKKGTEINQPYKTVENGFIVYNPYRVDVGSVGLKTQCQEHRYISPAYVVFRCRETLLPEFLYILFKTRRFLEMIRLNTSGSVRQSLSFKQLAGMSIPVPDKEMQEHLAERFLNMQAVADGDDIIAGVLEEECKNFPADAAGIRTLKKIKKEPNQMLQFPEFKTIARWSVEYYLDWWNLEALKQSLCPVVRFGKIVESFQYGVSTRASADPRGDNSIPVIRMNNIVDSQLDLSDLKYISTPLKNNAHHLQKGDLLFNRTNSKELVGKTAVFDREGDYTYASYLIRVRLKKDKADVDYINTLFDSHILRSQIDRESRQVLGQANINSHELSRLKLPLPPLPIQKQVAATIKRLRTEINLLREEARQLHLEAEGQFEEALFLS